MEPIIQVENLGKKYNLWHQRQSGGLRHALQDALSFKWLWKRGKNTTEAAREDFWALHDISFEVQPGEVLGVIGRNGAGKSTLLKVLSRITEPTTGSVKINGRVASLLEVGTGFHYELTGRENIFLNGTILGMTRREIKKKFDEIVSFAEVEKFLDTPVKHYSSGMFVRLAFAVAAHLEPEILIIDEVLAVGDAQFQKKCLGKMEDVSRREGRTVLFVSHNMTAVSALTNRVLLLDKGAIAYSGTTQEGIERYMAAGGAGAAIYEAEPSTKMPNVTRMEVICSEPGQIHESGKPWTVKIKLHYPWSMPKACFSIQIINQYEVPVLYLAAYDDNVSVFRRVGENEIECHVPSLNLNVGTYYLKTRIQDPPGGDTYDVVDGACPFEVTILSRMSPFGWRPTTCTHFEPCSWSVQ